MTAVKQQWGGTKLLLGLWITYMIHGGKYIHQFSLKTNLRLGICKPCEHITTLPLWIPCSLVKNKRGKQTRGHRGPGNRCSSSWSAEENQTTSLLIGHCSSLLLDMAARHLWGTSCKFVPHSGPSRDQEITAVAGPSPAACSGHVNSDLIRHNLLPWANLEKCPSGERTETPRAKFSFDRTERETRI